MSDHERPASVERREHLEQLMIAALSAVRVEEPVEEPLEGLRQARPLQEAEEQVVDAEGGHVVRRLPPLAPAPVQDGEIGPLAEEKVPRMEVAVAPRQPVGEPAQPPAPLDRGV